MAEHAPVLVVLHGGTGSMRQLFGRRGGAMPYSSSLRRASSPIHSVVHAGA